MRAKTNRSYRMYADFAIRDAISSHDATTRFKKLSEAFNWAEQAHIIAKAASKTSPWVAAALYYMGRIRVLQDNFPEAK